jgi:hypothetical protein
MINLKLGALSRGRWYDYRLSFLHDAAKLWMLHVPYCHLDDLERLSLLVFLFFYDFPDSFSSWQALYHPRSWPCKLCAAMTEVYLLEPVKRGPTRPGLFAGRPNGHLLRISQENLCSKFIVF